MSTVDAHSAAASSALNATLAAILSALDARPRPRRTPPRPRILLRPWRPPRPARRRPPLLPEPPSSERVPEPARPPRSQQLPRPRANRRQHQLPRSRCRRSPRRSRRPPPTTRVRPRRGCRRALRRFVAASSTAAPARRSQAGRRDLCGGPPTRALPTPARAAARPPHHAHGRRIPDTSGFPAPATGNRRLSVVVDTLRDPEPCRRAPDGITYLATGVFSLRLKLVFMVCRLWEVNHSAHDFNRGANTRH